MSELDLKAPVLSLKNGTMPQVGFGTNLLKGDDCRRAVEAALACGCRQIDTAAVYQNHVAVGQALTQSGLDRSEFFVTSKVWRDQLHYAGVISACELALSELNLDFLDLYLIHWPNNDIPMDDTFRAMAKLIERGLIRNCGVSNFTVERLHTASSHSEVPISANQVEYHPYLNQEDLRRYCQSRGIAMIAYAPLAEGRVVKDHLLQEIGRKIGKTAVQVTLRWLMQKNIAVIPKASSPERIRGNFDVLDWSLSPEDMQQIDSRKVWNRFVNWDVAEFDRAGSYNFQI